MQVKSIAGKHSAILLTFIKLPFVIKIFVLIIFEWPFYTGFTVRRSSRLLWQTNVINIYHNRFNAEYSHWSTPHYTVTHMSNKNSNIQGRSSNVIKVIFHTKRNCSSGSKLFPLREVPILKRDAVEENHCLFQ